MGKSEKVSVHGGHSGQFCSHAEDQLEDIVQAYIAQGFSWVGITEHIPPVSESFLYCEEIADGLDYDGVIARFADYIAECRRLQQKYAARIRLFVGMETETCDGFEEHVAGLKARFSPDYIVGSVHHAAGVAFDYSQEEYMRAVEACGGLAELYSSYFDAQYRMLCALQPEVVGHFDLIRIFDPDYTETVRIPAVWQRVVRNLEYIADAGLILDYNLRALDKGAKEPYVSEDILAEAQRLNIAVVPGDDSHGVADVGRQIDTGIKLLQQSGFSLDWMLPAGQGA